MHLRIPPQGPAAVERPPVTVTTAPLFRWAIAGIVAVNVANAVNLFFLDRTHDFLLAVERNPSTWLGAAILAAGAVLAWLASVAQGDRHWRTVGILLLLMSLDEVAGFHERFGSLPAAPRVGSRAWIGVGLIVVAVVAWRLVPWALAQPPQVRLALLGGAGCFVLGAIGFEQLAGAWVADHGDDRVFFVLSSIEENLEYAGALWAASGIATRVRGLRLGLAG